jgi:hypothetical protein
VAALARKPPRSTAFIERWRERERAAGRATRVDRVWVPYAAIAPSAKLAVLVAEDVNFFSHRGFDTGEIRDALARAVEVGDLPRGASTITQQLAKNLWLSPSRDPLRKAREAMLTWQLERALGKRRILELYLNVVEFGPGVWGIERQPALLRQGGCRPRRRRGRRAGGVAAEPGHVAPRLDAARLPAPHRGGAAAHGQGAVPQAAALRAYTEADEPALHADLAGGAGPALRPDARLRRRRPFGLAERQARLRAAAPRS